MSHLGIFGLQVDRQIMLSQHVARRGTDRSDNRLPHRSPHGLFHPQQASDLEHVGHLNCRGEQYHIDVALGEGPQVVGQGLEVLRQLPAVYRHRQHARTTGFESGDQADIRLAVLLDRDHLVVHRDVLVDRRQQFAPGVRLIHDVGRCESDFAHGVGDLGPPCDRDDVGQRMEVAFPTDLPCDGPEQMLKADPRQEHDHADVTDEHALGEFRCGRSVGERNLSQRGGDAGRSGEPFDESRDFVCAPTLKGGHAQSVEAGGGICHASYLRAAPGGHQGGPEEVRCRLSGASADDANKKTAYPSNGRAGRLSSSPSNRPT